ncbi:MAG: inositol-3-phosphate synthase, partial [Calditrichaeota bacterium]
MKTGVDIKPATGKLGILTPGMGAVATTFVAGCIAVKKGVGKPIGSLTQMGSIRLGKRTDNRTPLIKDFVPLADMGDLVFGGWDIFEDNVYEAALNAGVLQMELLDQIKDELSAIKPMKAVFDPAYVKKLNGSWVKKGKTKMELAEQLREDIRNFKSSNNLDRVVIVWCGSTEIFMEASEVHNTVESF